MESLLSHQFGACVRELRKAAGMSQVVFSERCGFYQTYLSRVENGQANPTLNALEVIANTLGLTIFELFAAVEQMPRPKRPSRKGRAAPKKRRSTS